MYPLLEDIEVDGLFFADVGLSNKGFESVVVVSVLVRDFIGLVLGVFVGDLVREVVGVFVG